MGCENCGFVVSPGQAAQSGTCPNCERPYRMQPTPLNSEMEMRDMPAPGEEDTGGNPLQEGVLGDYQNRGVRDEAFASVQKTAEKTDDGWTNWDTQNVNDWLMNDQNLHDGVSDLVSKGGTPEDLRDYAMQHVIGPHNKSVMDDAQSWNSIPEPERLDPSYEELMEKSKGNPNIKGLVDGITGGPDVGDYDPTNDMIDPEMVNWNELHQYHAQDNEDTANWEKEKADKEAQGYGWGAGAGWPMHTTQMMNAWMPYHGAPATENEKLPTGNPARQHMTDAPIDEYSQSPDWMEDNYGPERWQQYQNQGFIPSNTHEHGFGVAHDLMYGRATPAGAAKMQAALQQAGYTPEQIAEITKQRYEMLEGGKRRELYPPPPASPNTSLDEPGDTFLPSNWTASTGAPEFEVTDVLVPDPESILSDKEQMPKKEADFLGDALQVAAPVAGGLVGSIVPGVGTALGAGIGAGLAGGGMAALQGGDVGDIAQTGITDAALGGIGGGLAGGALNALGTGTGTALEGSLAGAAGTAGADTLENAAATGATKGGIGSLMKSAWGKIPTQKIQNAYMMHSLMNDASGQMQQATTPAPNMLPTQPTNPSIYSAVETPTSHGEIPSNDTSDPEEVDFHENEDKKDPKSEMDINDVGGTDLGPDDFFGAESGGLAAFAELLPKVLEFALSDKSAAGDPDMEDLHQKLEAEAPGYMNGANDDDGHKLVVMMMKGGPQDEDGSDESLSDNDTPHDPISEHEATALRPGLENTCPRCGGVIDPSTGRCPQCGQPNINGNPMGMTDPIAQAEGMPAMTVQGAATQGPNTDQQKAAVAELLQQEGRGEEVPTMLMEPWNYADELSKITQQEEPPESIGQEGPPPAVPPSQPGEMPVPGMSAPPGGGGGAGGPQMMAAINKYATSVDGFCEHCPKCGSHSTGYIDYEEGDAGCKTCGHKWKAEKMVKKDSHIVTSEGYLMSPGQSGVPQQITPTPTPAPTPAAPNNGGKPGCPWCAEGNCSKHGPLAYDRPGYETYDEVSQRKLEEKYGPMQSSVLGAAEDLHAAPVEPELSAVQPEQEQEQNSSLSWTDEEGSPLKVGQSYEMYSQNYDIPDRITVTAVKPDVIEYTINGEYGLSHQSELTHEEAKVDGERFVPAEPERGEPVFEENQGAQPMDPPPGQQTDLSTPHEMMTSKTAIYGEVPPIEEMREALRQMNIDPNRFDDETVKSIYDAAASGGIKPTNDPLEQAYRADSIEHPLGPTTGRTADFNDLNPPGVDGAGGPRPMPVEENDVTNRDAGNATKIIEALLRLGFPEAMARQEAIRLQQELGKHEMNGVAEDIQAAPETEHPMGPTASAGPRTVTRSSQPQDSAYRMGSAPPLEESLSEGQQFVASEFDDHPVYQGDSPAPQGLHGPDWLMDGSRTAGAHMSPWEQRGYIDETGDARNADKLQLDGTHYEMDDLLNDSFLFGL